MYYVRSKYQLVFCLVVVFSCKTKNHIPVNQYEMVSYDSKAWIEPVEFPIITFNTDSTFEIFQQKLLIPERKNKKRLDTLTFKGRVYMQSDSLVLITDKGVKLYGIYIDKLKKIFRLSRLVDIGIETYSGDFKKIE